VRRRGWAAAQGCAALRPRSRKRDATRDARYARNAMRFARRYALSVVSGVGKGSPLGGYLAGVRLVCLTSVSRHAIRQRSRGDDLLLYLFCIIRLTSNEQQRMVTLSLLAASGDTAMITQCDNPDCPNVHTAFHNGRSCDWCGCSVDSTTFVPTPSPEANCTGIGATCPNHYEGGDYCCAVSEARAITNGTHA